MKAPFVWFGGKRRIAHEVWAALGDPDNYVEPFAGSLACLLERPHDMSDCHRRAETVNDADGFIANFWRALAHDPEAVAFHCDWPVNEVDLFARHLWLVNTGRSVLLNNMEADPDFYDAKIAGWWVWGINAWIGSGWCSGDGPWLVADDGTVSKRPHLGNAGRGVNRNRPHLGNRGSDKPSGRTASDATALGHYFEALATRLRDVRVCCGDWSRVVTRGALSYGSTVGVFLDPPYLGDVRTADLYAVDDHTIAHEVRQWCLDNGDDPRYRIVLAGYADEHDHLMPDTWRRVRWSSTAAYQTTANKGGQNADNRHKEVLWCSPHCLDPGSAQPTLFGEAS